MIGISIYLSKEKETFNKKWIKKAAENSFTTIFTSLHIPEGDTSSYKSLLIDLGKEAKAHQMELVADISPKSFDYLNMDLQSIDQLQDIGVTRLRVDDGLSVDEIVELSQKINISLNASTLNKSFLQKLTDHGLNTENTEAAHNFYPRPETGLAKDYFIRKNHLLKEYGMRISAFIPGDGQKRQPLYEGLPTLEVHRYMTPVEAYLDLTKQGLVDTVYIGDPSLCDETLRKLSLINQDIIPLRYKGVSRPEFASFHQYLNSVQINRPDPARDVIRFAQSRLDLQHNQNLYPINTIIRKKGSITIDNSEYGRYAGEIHITKTDLKQDDKVNVLGEVIEEDIPLLDFIGGSSQVLLAKVNESEKTEALKNTSCNL